MDDEDDPVEPLVCVASAIEIEAFADDDDGDPRVLRLVFQSTGAGSGMPGGGVTEVAVFEAWDRVSVALNERIIAGDGPDDLHYGGELLIRRPSAALDVVLREPLGDRPLIDIATGATVGRLEPDAAHRADAERLGVPRWVP